MTLKAFSAITKKKVYSDAICLCGYDWRLMVYPPGDGSDGSLSLYVKIANAKSLILSVQEALRRRGYGGLTQLIITIVADEQPVCG